MTPPSPARRKRRMLRAEGPPADVTLLVRAIPAARDAAVRDMAESALDSAEVYEVEFPDGLVVPLYGVSVFGRPADVEPIDLLRRFAAAPFYLEASVRDVRSAGFRVLPTGTRPDHFDIVLIEAAAAGQVPWSILDLESAARRLVAACGDMRPNPSYAGGVYG